PGSSHDLRSARADADDVDRALLRSGVPADHIVAIRDTQASARVVRLAAQWLVARAGADSLAVFFYAGHARRIGPSTQAVVGADGQLVTDRELASLLAPLRSRQAWIGMAACYGAGFDELLAPGRVLTGAAPANALAYENSGFGRSYMVEYMIRQAMLERLAPGTVQDAFGFARSRIAQDYPGREPVQIDAGADPLSFAGPALSASPSSASAGGQAGRTSSGGPTSDAPSSDSQPGPTTTTTAPPPRRNCVPTPLGRVCQ
ncbi:MAG: hypothetical protein QOG03_1590, partial [Actinomycetota bacterium]|nr:hypothetical protein [Actinomycetota bacterium]